MGFSTVLIISLAAGVILIVGGGLMYMANIVKSAYEIKVQINNEVDDRLSKMGEDLDKKSKWIKRDMIEEFEKIKGNMQGDNSKRLEELVAPLATRIENMEAQLRAEQAEWRRALEAERVNIAEIESRLKGGAKLAPRPAADGSPKAPTLAGERPKGSSKANAEPSKPAGPAPVSAILQEL